MNKPSIQAAPLASGFKLKGQGEGRIDLNRCNHDTAPGFFNEWSVPTDPEPERLTFALARTLSYPLDFDALAADDFYVAGSGNKARRRAAELDGEGLQIAAQLAAIKVAISDPEQVFINMKAGAIAKPTLRSMVDLYGEVVNGEDAQLLEIARLRAENQILADQVKALQSDQNSWQSGYNRGREMGGKDAQSERAQLKVENEKLRTSAPVSGVMVPMKTGDLTGRALEWAVLIPVSDQPKTFGCHHNMPTCGHCEDMVRSWLAKELGETVEVPREFVNL